MYWIGRFFLVIALIFLALDIVDPLTPPGAGTPPPAAETTIGANDGASDGATGETADGAADDAAADGDTAATPPPPPAVTVPPAVPAATGTDEVVLWPLGARWFAYHSDSYQLVSPAISRHVSPWLDDNIVQPLLLQPAFLIFFVLWLIFGFFSWLIGRARREDDW